MQGFSSRAIYASAKATLRDGGATVTLLFRFNDAGWINSIHADARGRTVNGAVVPTPWEGRMWHYEVRDGLHIPLEAEVAWLLPEGRKPYWRGRMTPCWPGSASSSKIGVTSWAQLGDGRALIEAASRLQQRSKRVRAAFC